MCIVFICLLVLILGLAKNMIKILDEKTETSFQTPLHKFSDCLFLLTINGNINKKSWENIFRYIYSVHYKHCKNAVKYMSMNTHINKKRRKQKNRKALEREGKKKKSIIALQKWFLAHTRIRLLSSGKKQLMGSHSSLSVPGYFQSDSELDLILKWSIHSQGLSASLHYSKG